MAEIYLACEPRVWQVRCFCSYKQGLNYQSFISAIDCGQVVDDWKLENGYVFGEDTYCGSTIQFGCNEGYRLNGTDSITCNKDGKWSGVKPNCYRKEHYYFD